MARVAVTEECLFNVDAPPEHAFKFFTNPQLFREAMHGVVRCEELDGQAVRWLLEEQAEQGVRFQPDYTVRYENDGCQMVRWNFVEGNLRNEGEIRVAKAVGGGSEIQYRETVEPDLPITPLLMMLLKPIITRQLRQGLRQFVERSTSCLTGQRHIGVA
jgi:Polyketide cyclase / dehydrase and lipid transport